MAGEVSFTPTEADCVAASRDWALRDLRRPRALVAPFAAAMAAAVLVALFVGDRAAPGAALRLALTAALLAAIVIVAIIAVRFLALPGRARRNFRQNKVMQKAQTFRWSDEGVGWESVTSRSLLPWQDLHRWAEGKQAFLFAISDRSIHFVPRRALDEAQANDLRALTIRLGPPRL